LPSRVAAAVSELATPPVRIHCTILHRGYTEPLGHSERRLRLIELQPIICRRLSRLASAPARTGTPAFADQAEALLVATHEAVHLSPYGAGSDEAHVECRAVQLVAAIALRIGLSNEQARALGHAALDAHERLPGPGHWMVGLHEMPSYQTPDCHDGGSLDIHPDANDWPN
jgi:hypothetical protein